MEEELYQSWSYPSGSDSEHQAFSYPANECGFPVEILRQIRRLMAADTDMEQNPWLPPHSSVFTNLMGQTPGSQMEIQTDDSAPTEGWILDWARDLGTDPHGIGMGNEINPHLRNELLSSYTLPSTDYLEPLIRVASWNLEQQGHAQPPLPPPPVPASGPNPPQMPPAQFPHYQPRVLHPAPVPASAPDTPTPQIQLFHYQHPISQPAPATQFADSIQSSTHLRRSIRFAPYRRDRSVSEDTPRSVSASRPGQAEDTRGLGVSVKYLKSAIL
jgi:hypothetical protein